MDAIHVAVNPFRYVAVDFVTGDVIGALPLHDVTFSSVLNGAGPMSASLHLPADDLEVAGAYIDATEETRRAIYIEYDGTVVWAGPIWTSDYDTDSQVVSIKGAEMWSYWRRRRIRWDATFTAVDQHEIARALLAEAEEALGGGLGLLFTHDLSDVHRDRVYRFFEDKPVAEAIEQLSQVENGFDFSLDVERDGNDYTRTWRTHYPARGRPVAESGLYLTLGNNMLRLQLPHDGTKVANSVRALGAGEGIDMLRATSTDLTALDAGYPLLEDSVAYKDVKRSSTLLAHAQSELAARRRPLSLPRATVRVDTDPLFGTYWPGDSALLRVLPATEPRWLAGIEVEARLNSYVVRPPDDGEPQLAELVFEELAA